MTMLRTAAPVAVLGLAVLVAPLLARATPADAATPARATPASAQQVGSGTWAVVPTTASIAPYGTGTLALNFPKVANTTAPPRYFNLANSGNLTVAGATYTVSGLDTTQVTVETCLGGTWNEAVGTCTGTIVTLVTTVAGTTTGTSVSTTAPAAVGTLLRTRVRPLAISKNATDTYTVSVAVARSQVRTPTTTNS